MKKIGMWLENLSCKIVCVISMVLLAAFSYWAGKYTHLLNVDLVNLKVRLYEDKLSSNLFWLLIILAVFYGISRMILTRDEGVNRKRVKIIAIGTALVAGIASIIWVIMHPYIPDHDQLQVVVDALDFLEGDYTDLKGYLEIFPYQIGLVSLYKIIFSICPNTEVIYFLHTIWIMLIVYFTYAVTEEIFENSRASLFSIIGVVSFVPMYFYVNYAYGDLGMAACGVLEIWFLIKFCKNWQVRYGIGLLVIAIIGYMIRTKFLIVMLAMFMVLVVYAVGQKKWRFLLVSALLLVLPLVTQKAVLTYYEQKAGVEMLKGSPAVLSIAMGMQDTYEGPGYYNAYNLTVYVNADKDADAAADIGKAYIVDRIAEMRHDLKYTKDFYQVKIWQQWNEPSFGGEVSTKTFQEEPTAVIQDIYYGKIQGYLRVFRNYYLFILYTGAFLGVLTKLYWKKDMDSIWKNIILVIFIGGFLFSLLWESKSRYVMPYVVMLIPYGAYGLYQVHHAVLQVIQQMRRKTLTRE